MFDDAYNEFVSYFNDIRLFAEITAIAAVYVVVALSVLGGIIAVQLTRLVDVQRKIGQHQVWAAHQNFRPTPDNPYPPKPW